MKERERERERWRVRERKKKREVVHEVDKTLSDKTVSC